MSSAAFSLFLSLSHFFFTVQPDPWNTHVWKGVNGTPTKKRAIGFKKLAKWVGEELETFALFVFVLSTKCMLSLTCTTLPRPAVCSAPNLCQLFVVILTHSSGTSVSGCDNGCLRVFPAYFPHNYAGMAANSVSLTHWITLRCNQVFFQCPFNVQPLCYYSNCPQDISSYVYVIVWSRKWGESVCQCVKLSQRVIFRNCNAHCHNRWDF